jgi:hypothetical protein
MSEQELEALIGQFGGWIENEEQICFPSPFLKEQFEKAYQAKWDENRARAA